MHSGITKTKQSRFGMNVRTNLTPQFSCSTDIRSEKTESLKTGRLIKHVRNAARLDER